MNGPTRRNLTFNFQRAINVVNGQQVAQTIEVAITPLATPSTPGGDLTLCRWPARAVGSPERRDQHPGLRARPVQRRWPDAASALSGVVPPGRYHRRHHHAAVRDARDADTDWDDLPDLGDVISGVSYVQQADVGVASGVAALNSSGQVIDIHGNPVAMPADLGTVSTSLAAEATARIAGDTAVTTAFESAVSGSATSTLASAKSYTDGQVSTLNAAIGSEAGTRANAINALTTTVGNDNTNLQGQITTNTTDIAANTTALGNKADKDGTGHVPIAQVPVAAITNWISVASQTAMKALTYPAQVQPRRHRLLRRQRQQRLLGADRHRPHHAGQLEADQHRHLGQWPGRRRRPDSCQRRRHRDRRVDHPVPGDWPVHRVGVAGQLRFAGHAADPGHRHRRPTTPRSLHTLGWGRSPTR